MSLLMSVPPTVAFFLISNPRRDFPRLVKDPSNSWTDLNSLNTQSSIPSHAVLMESDF